MEDNVINVCICSCYVPILKGTACVGYVRSRDCEFNCKLYSCKTCHTKCPEIVLGLNPEACPNCENRKENEIERSYRFRRRVLCIKCGKILVNTKTPTPKQPWAEHQMHRSCWLAKNKTESNSSSSDEDENEKDKDYNDL